MTWLLQPAFELQVFSVNLQELCDTASSLRSKKLGMLKKRNLYYKAQKSPTKTLDSYLPDQIVHILNDIMPV